jgi:glyoxylase-like metal-dependent hydrolase (beta-lactamase superfamily II)
MENLYTITIRSTHFYLFDTAGGALLIDAGWAGSLPAFLAELKNSKVALNRIRYIMFTHAHPDHAGLVQEIKQASGARLLIHEVQLPFLPELAAFHRAKKDPSYVPIEVGPQDIVLRGDPRTGDGRAPLHTLGIGGEVLLTPGHSDDSISFLTTSGLAFTGDLTLPGLAEAEKAETVANSWRRLFVRGAHTCYPAHGSPASREQLEALLRQSEQD